MAKYMFTVSTRRNWESKTYNSLVKCRKDALSTLRADYSYHGFAFVYEIKDGKAFQIGNINEGVKSVYYKANKMGMPRPNNIKPGTWYMNGNGTLGERISNN